MRDFRTKFCFVILFNTVLTASQIHHLRSVLLSDDSLSELPVHYNGRGILFSDQSTLSLRQSRRKPGDLLTESAVQNAVLQRNHNLVICFSCSSSAVSCPVI